MTRPKVQVVTPPEAAKILQAMKSSEKDKVAPTDDTQWVVLASALRMVMF